MSYPTVTSDNIISGLIKNGVVLKPEDKQLIHDLVYNAVVEAAKWESNGCDCGQVWCQTCN